MEVISVQSLRTVRGAVRRRLMKLTSPGGMMKDWLNIISPPVWVAIAHRNRSVVGWSALAPLCSNGEVYMIGVFVTKKARMNGLGTQLVETVIHQHRMRKAPNRIFWAPQLPRKIARTIEYWESTRSGKYDGDKPIERN